MASYDDFLPWVMVEAPGCSEIMAVQTVRDAAIDFCVRSNFIQRDHDPISVVANTIDYDLDPPAGQLVVKVMKAWYKASELEPVAPDYVNDPLFYNKKATGVTPSKSTPMVYTQKDERTVSIFPYPLESASSALTLRVSLKPTRSSTTCEDSLLEDYAETIACGALARLLASPGKAYSAPQLVNVHQAKFMSGVNEARQRASRGQVRTNMQVKMRRI
jgi:hypothetical protein